MNTDDSDFDFDFDMTEVADLVKYILPANGTHIYALVYCGPDMTRGDDATLGLSFVYQKLATVELAKEDSIDAPVGSLCKETFANHKVAKQIVKERVKQFFGEQALLDAIKRGEKSIAPFLNELGRLKYSEFYVQMTTKVITKKDMITFEFWIYSQYQRM